MESAMLHKWNTRRPKGNGQVKTLLLACICFVSPLVLSPSAAAEGRGSRADIESTKVFSAQESKEIGDAVQRRDEARQKAWDHKMKTITKAVCVGC